jgi:hypothetical protein
MFRILKKYWIWFEIVIILTALVLMLYYRFWEDEPGKKVMRWFQFIVFIYFLYGRIAKLRNRFKKAE